MYAQSQRRIVNVSVALLLVASLLLPILLISNRAGAASLTQVFVRFDRMKISTQTTGTVCAKPATTATEADVQVTFPTGYTLGTSGNFTVNTTDTYNTWPTGGTAWLGINTASNVTGQVVTFPSSDLTAGTLYCFNWTNAAAVQVKSSATSSNTGSVTTRTSTPTNIDSSEYATASITDDQIVVTATVPSVFQFALSGNSDAIGNLDSTLVKSSPTPKTATVSTNAKNGWKVWAKDSNTGLYSSNANSTIASTTPGTVSTLSAGANGYNMGVTSSQVGGSGAITIDAAFVGNASYKGGGLDTNLRNVASSNGTADTAVLTLTNNVSISPTQSAANDYTDTITVIGAGLF